MNRLVTAEMYVWRSAMAKRFTRRWNEEDDE